MDKLLERITVSSEICNGQPIIRGMRISVKTIIDYLAAGETMDNILSAYPQLEQKDIQACLYFAARTLEKKVYTFELAS